MRLLPGCLPKASDLMASVSPQRCSPQLVVKFKSCRQHSAHLPRQTSSIRRKVTALSICQRAFYRGRPFAQRSHGPPLTCEQSRQADLQLRLLGSMLTPRDPGGRTSLSDSASPFLPSHTALGVEPFISVSLEGVNKNTYLSVPQMAKTESEQCPVMACQVKPMGFSGSVLTTVSAQNHKESPSKELHHKVYTLQQE